jgi:PTH1 family peptidyl-tRNA hydrolase
MWLVVGLGNPGAKYERNRHNIGFLAVDSIAGKLGASGWTKKFGGLVGELRHNESRVYLLKPQTYMNLSGDAVATAAGFYKIPADHIIVLHDELDLLAGKLKVKQAGGDGGHNGIRSIDAHIGKDYRRVRIGIGHPGDKDMVSGYVLSDFSHAEEKIQVKMIESITANFPLLLQNDDAGFMNKVALEMRD